ncbi:unnamed protein product [Vitrella brassicaformis CCMP3155]|uniref:Uncharacterized protein n=1 Tax=Vitrella brassicaformis (strain CCMP3155) TaxID=1169540 RepID=A0A0G4FQG1_VITBC|nr:unnamed protein product [Vitrella brassicaformis CCMP3155]|eukprot:CEM16674.1 unnamed protein product [Vitrella brassicaformis CCMP3155]
MEFVSDASPSLAPLELLSENSELLLRRAVNVFGCSAREGQDIVVFTVSDVATTIAASVKDGVNQWDRADRSTCGYSTDVFLGKLVRGSVSRLYKKLPPHRHVKVTARIHYFDRWTGESVYLKAGNKIVWARSHNLVFGSTLTESNADIVSWGVDDVTVHLQ